MEAARALLAPGLDLLERLVNLDTGSRSTDGVAAGLGVVADELSRLGGERIDDGSVIAIEYRFLGEGLGRALFLGHVDTVFDQGEAKHRPFVISDGKAMGPAVADMKAGLVTILMATEILCRRSERPWGEIVVLVNGDEEIGSPRTEAAIRNAAQASDFCLVFEPGRINGAVVTKRKGVGRFTLRVRGRAAHAGTDPELGASALLDLAHKLVALKELVNQDVGVTVNAIVTIGGTRSNVVPAVAEAEIDLRFPTVEIAGTVIERLKQITSTVDVPGTVAELFGGVNRPPLEPGEGGQALYATARRVAHDLGFELPEESAGGGSDGNFVASMGVPTLDGMGACGRNYHRDDEFVLVNSIPQRAALAAALVLELCTAATWSGMQLRSS